MLVAPVLAILAWFAVDRFVGERPHAAKPGATYSLVARSNCRYDSGQCDLVNGEFEITLRATDVTDASVALELVSKHSLEAATLGLVETDASDDPVRMAPAGSDATRWAAGLPRPTSPESSLRVAVVADGATYYAQVPVVFLRLES